MTNGDDWIKNLAAEIKADRKRKELEAERLLEERKIRASHGQKLWEEIRNTIQKDSNRLNLELEEELLTLENNHSCELRLGITDLPQALTGSYNDAIHQVSFESPLFPEGRLNYEIQITRSGKVELVAEIGQKVNTPEQIAQFVLRRVLKGKFSK